MAEQVHLAQLRGEEVVVKVQRPGLRQLFDIDLKNIRVLAQWLQAVDPNSDGAARDWVAIYDECSKILYQVCASQCSGAKADVKLLPCPSSCCRAGIRLPLDGLPVTEIGDYRRSTTNWRAKTLTSSA